MWIEMGAAKTMEVGTVGILPPLLSAVIVLVTPRGSTKFEEMRWIFTLSVALTMVLGWPGVVYSESDHKWIRTAVTNIGICLFIIVFV
jgi:hypothetical protein